MKILITGGAGFIGCYCAKKLIQRGEEVVLVDNLNDYYSPKLKKDRLEKLLAGKKYEFYREDIRDYAEMKKIFSKEKPDKIIHLAAMAGVRNSFRKPLLYEETNIKGTLNLLKLSVEHKVKNFVFASSSSVYGNNSKIPFSEDDKSGDPASIYGATKKATELLAHIYHTVYGLKISGLRYFTVYGPWGRPDMAYFKFTESILKNDPIDVYNHGKMSRSFTYIDDVVAGTLKVLDADLDYAILNIGSDKEEKLLRFIKIIEDKTGKRAKKKMLVNQPGDVKSTVADISKIRKLGWQPKTAIEEGLQNFVDWYKDYYGIER
jgi:UDP-glucuronate 4-epimerase